MENSNSNNSVSFQGYLGKTPDFKELRNNMSLATVSIAISENIKINNSWERKTTWHKLVFWNDNAHMAINNFKKGDLIKVIGKITQNEYIDKLGNKCTSENIIVKSAFIVNQSQGV